MYYVNAFIGEVMGNRYLRVRKKQNKFSEILVITVLVLMMAIVSYNRYELGQKRDALEKQEAQLDEQIEAEKARTIEIEEYAKYTKTKAYAEKIAKEKLGLVNENEIIYKNEE